MKNKSLVKTLMIGTLLVVLLIAADQIVKYLSQLYIAPSSVVPLVGGIIDLTYVQNTGAAFSIFNNSFYFLLAVRLIATCAIVWALIRYHDRLHALLRISMALILAGALGNLIDQIFLGYVRDMFAFHFIEFAVFNVADACITIGAVLLFFDLFFLKGKTLFSDKGKTESQE